MERDVRTLFSAELFSRIKYNFHEKSMSLDTWESWIQTLSKGMKILKWGNDCMYIFWYKSSFICHDKLYPSLKQCTTQTSSYTTVQKGKHDDFHSLFIKSALLFSYGLVGFTGLQRQRAFLLYGRLWYQ